MSKKHLVAAVAIAFALPLGGCQGNSMGEAARSAGDTVASAAQSAASSATSLVNVNLSNVLNDLALDLNIDRANIPVNAQIPITVAANICGVSINILSVSTGGQANCTATTTSPQLAQAVQQQIAAGGSVGGGAQTSGTGTASTGTTTQTGTTGTTTGATGTATVPTAEPQTQPPQQ